MVGRIGDRATFEALRASGRRARSGPLAVTFSPEDGPEPRVAYAVGRRVGGAVQRNRVRRRLRAAVARAADDITPGAYLVSAAPGTKDMTFEELTTTVRSAMRQAGRTR